MNQALFFFSFCQLGCVQFPPHKIIRRYTRAPFFDNRANGAGAHRARVCNQPYESTVLAGQPRPPSPRAASHRRHGIDMRGKVCGELSEAQIRGTANHCCRVLPGTALDATPAVCIDERGQRCGELACRSRAQAILLHVAHFLQPSFTLLRLFYFHFGYWRSRRGFRLVPTASASPYVFDFDIDHCYAITPPSSPRFPSWTSHVSIGSGIPHSATSRESTDVKGRQPGVVSARVVLGVSCFWGGRELWT